MPLSRFPSRPFDKDFLILKSRLDDTWVKHGVGVCLDGLVEDKFHLIFCLGAMLMLSQRQKQQSRAATV